MASPSPVPGEGELVPRTVKIPLSDAEERAFNALLARTWQKKGGFLRLAILKALENQEMARLAEAASVPHIPEFVTLETAAALKGGAAVNTYKSRPRLQPCGGRQYVRVGGKKCWRRADVEEWLSVDDAGLDEYLATLAGGGEG